MREKELNCKNKEAGKLDLKKEAQAVNIIDTGYTKC